MRDFDPQKVPKPPGLSDFNWKLSSGPIALELGCGNGLHPIQYALQNPERAILAIEQTQNRFESFKKNLERHPGLHNIFAFRADAIWWCAHNLNKEFLLDEVFILYPNPYPKESQANKRYHNMPFMGFLLDHLKSGGRVTLASNIPTYVEEAKIQFVSQWDLQLACEETVKETSSPRTAFEKKYLARGETCFNLVFKK